MVKVDKGSFDVLLNKIKLKQQILKVLEMSLETNYRARKTIASSNHNPATGD